MFHIFNKTISNEKSIIYALIELYGINKFQSKKICHKIGINPITTINNLKKNQINKLINYLNKNIKIESKLKKEKQDKINNLLIIKHYRGLRRVLGLPVNGQRTHTNAKTVKKLKSK